MITYIGRYSSEITTKSKITRLRLIEKLKKAILNAFSFYGIQCIDARFRWDYFYIVPSDDIRDILAHIPGINSFAECKFIVSKELNDILEWGEKWFSGIVKGKKFAVRARVNISRKKFSYKDIEVKLGEILLRYAAGVNLTTPDVTCYVEVLRDGTFFYDARENGMDGFPISSDRVLHFISGGIDSPVALVNLVRRGCYPVLLYFDLGSDLQTQSVLAVSLHIYKKFIPGFKVNLLILDIRDVIPIIKKRKPSYQNLLLKALFYKIGEIMALRHKCKAISTGEVSGQVSTQTLHNLILLSSMINMQVLRPLLTSSKSSIIDSAIKYGTYDFSYKGSELCAIQTRNVATKGKKKILMEEFALLMQEINIDELISRVKCINLEELARDNHSTDDFNLLEKDISGYVVIDLRPPSIKKQYPIKNAIEGDLNEVISRISERALPLNKKYLVVCEHGALSGMVASLMRDMGYNATNLKNGLSPALYKKLYGGG